MNAGALTGQQAQIDARLLVIALRQMLYAADLQTTVARSVPEEVRKHLGVTKKEFEAALPGIVVSRNRLIHFDKLVTGMAKWLGKILATGVGVLSAVRDQWSFGYDPTTEEIASGPGTRFTLDSARRVASKLNQAIWWAGHVYACQEPPDRCPACRGFR